MLTKKTPMATSASTMVCPLLPINLTFLIDIDIKKFSPIIENKNRRSGLPGERTKNYFIRAGNRNCFGSWKILILALIARGKTVSFKGDKIVVVSIDAVWKLIKIDHR